MGPGEKLQKACRRLPDGIDPREVIEWLAAGNNLRLVADVQISRSQIVPLTPPQEVFTLMIDYRKSFKEMVELGHYDDVNSNIFFEDRFRVKAPVGVKGIVEVEAKLFKFEGKYGCKMYSDQAKALIEEKAGWRISKTEHLLAFGAQHIEKLGYHMVVALDSPDLTFKLCIERDSKCSLDLNATAYDFDTFFLAFRPKIS